MDTNTKQLLLWMTAFIGVPIGLGVLVVVLIMQFAAYCEEYRKMAEMNETQPLLAEQPTP